MLNLYAISIDAFENLENRIYQYILWIIFRFGVNKVFHFKRDSNIITFICNPIFYLPAFQTG